MRPGISTMSRRLRLLYSPIKYFKQRYPKAAKKKRVMKKWINRFGPDVDIKSLVYRVNPVLSLIPKEDWGGKYYPIPILDGSES